jgi:hypothetical protein
MHVEDERGGACAEREARAVAVERAQLARLAAPALPSPSPSADPCPKENDR